MFYEHLVSKYFEEKFKPYENYLEEYKEAESNLYGTKWYLAKSRKFTLEITDYNVTFRMNHNYYATELGKILKQVFGYSITLHVEFDRFFITASSLGVDNNIYSLITTAIAGDISRDILTGSLVGEALGSDIPVSTAINKE